jgi:hypothetical protein
VSGAALAAYLTGPVVSAVVAVRLAGTDLRHIILRGAVLFTPLALLSWMLERQVDDLAELVGAGLVIAIAAGFLLYVRERALVRRLWTQLRRSVRRPPTVVGTAVDLEP